MLNDAATKSQRIMGVDGRLLRRFVTSGLKIASKTSLFMGDGSLSIGVCLGIRRSLKRGSFVGIATATLSSPRYKYREMNRKTM